MEMQKNIKVMFDFFKKEDNSKNLEKKKSRIVENMILTMIILTIVGFLMMFTFEDQNRLQKTQNKIDNQRIANIEIIKTISPQKFEEIISFIDGQEKIQEEVLNKAYWEVKYIDELKISPPNIDMLNYENKISEIQTLRNQIHDHFMERKLLMLKVFDLVSHGQNNVVLSNTTDGKNPYEVFVEWIELKKVGKVVYQPAITNFIDELQPYLSNQTQLITYLNKHQAEMEQTRQFNKF